MFPFPKVTYLITLKCRISVDIVRNIDLVNLWCLFRVSLSFVIKYSVPVTGDTGSTSLGTASLFVFLEAIIVQFVRSLPVRSVDHTFLNN